MLFIGWGDGRIGGKFTLTRKRKGDWGTLKANMNLRGDFRYFLQTR